MNSDRDNGSTRENYFPINCLEMNLKNQLRLYLEKEDLTISQLARKASIPKQSLSGWLAGSNPRDIRQVRRVAEALKITVDHLVFGKGTDEPSSKVTDLESIFGDQWVGGLFEVRFRRVKK